MLSPPLTTPPNTSPSPTFVEECRPWLLKVWLFCWFGCTERFCCPKHSLPSSYFLERLKLPPLPLMALTWSWNLKISFKLFLESVLRSTFRMRPYSCCLPCLCWYHHVHELWSVIKCKFPSVNFQSLFLLESNCQMGFTTLEEDVLYFWRPEVF